MHTQLMQLRFEIHTPRRLKEEEKRLLHDRVVKVLDATVSELQSKMLAEEVVGAHSE